MSLFFSERNKEQVSHLTANSSFPKVKEEEEQKINVNLFPLNRPRGSAWLCCAGTQPSVHVFKRNIKESNKSLASAHCSLKLKREVYFPKAINCLEKHRLSAFYHLVSVKYRHWSVWVFHYSHSFYSVCCSIRSNLNAEEVCFKSILITCLISDYQKSLCTFLVFLSNYYYYGFFCRKITSNKSTNSAYASQPSLVPVWLKVTHAG